MSAFLSTTGIHWKQTHLPCRQCRARVEHLPLSQTAMSLPCSHVILRTQIQVDTWHALYRREVSKHEASGSTGRLASDRSQLQSCRHLCLSKSRLVELCGALHTPHRCAMIDHHVIDHQAWLTIYCCCHR